MASFIILSVILAVINSRTALFLLFVSATVTLGLAASDFAALPNEVWMQLRLPRILLAAFTGAALALAGLLLQTFFRNPLVEPGLLGISAGAGLGAVIAISLGLGGLWLLPLSAFAGALGTLALILLLGRQLRGNNAELLLAGVAINSLAAALINLILSVGDATTLRSAIFWLMGSFTLSEWPLLLASMAALTACIIWTARKTQALDVWQLGESEAIHLGINIHHFRRQILGVTSLLVALAVAQSGGIGFIGLLAPHMARRLGLAQHRLLLPATLALGMTLAVLSDLLARRLIYPMELPVGVLTALVGAPAFLLLFLRRNRS
ncbi:MAG: iron ABC transporter permease [Moraxellaceae bacterium]|nr:iron ABC transporter permease [Moraxellaceae bacterium]MBP8851960.1 iron ABC transporter permease [Moraxellaceae bacterium]